MRHMRYIKISSIIFISIFTIINISFAQKNNNVIVFLSMYNRKQTLKKLIGTIREDIPDLQELDLPIMHIINKRRIIFKVFKGTRGDKRLIFCFAPNYIDVHGFIMLEQMLIDNFNVNLFIFFANSGAISDEAQIGDVYIPDVWYIHDEGMYTDRGFISRFEIEKMRGGNTSEHKIVRVLIEKIKKMNFSDMKKIIHIEGQKPRIIVGGVGVSGNSWIDSKKKREELYNIFDAKIVDTRSAGMIEVGNINKIPIVSIKSVIDFAGKESIEPGDSKKIAMPRFYEGLCNAYYVSLYIIDNLDKF